MKNNIIRIILITVFAFMLLLVNFSFPGCSKKNDDNGTTPDPPITKNLTIFFINDNHGQINNFSKIKHIIDQERQENNVLVACSGDMFSGNPVVDNHPEKGYPLIDIMNRIGFDVTVIGNHEYDYGEEALKDRMDQSSFDWICANVDVGNSVVPEPFEYTSITIDDLKVTFLGLVETNGKDNATIPSTHPWKVQSFTFQRPEDVVSQYANIKSQENADLYIALTHLGYNSNNYLGDVQLATQFPYFDMIIGGHSHQEINTTINNIPIFQSGSYLHKLGKIELSVINKKIEWINFSLIDLDTYTGYDATLKDIIDDYNDLPYLNDVIGYSHIYHEKNKVGCFYTDALKGKMNVDVTFQNTGGVRSGLNQGDITKREIFEISPFNNGTVIYNMTVSDIKYFLKGSASGFYYAGIQIDQSGSNVLIRDTGGNIIADNTVLSIGINDYIPAVHDQYFPTNGNVQPLTAAETIIAYLEEINNQVNYPNCGRYFRYQD